MEVLSHPDGFSRLSNNAFFGDFPKMENSKISFSGTGNVFYCESGVVLRNSNIKFAGNNGLLMLGRDRHAYILDVSLNNNCSLTIGRECYFNGLLHIIVSEECEVIIGNGCLFSFGVWIRTADPHLVYDAKSGERINPSKGVLIGDHVWIGQGAMILKGSAIGSGSILGAMGVVAGKRLKSNCSFAGNPVKLIREGLFWDEACVHAWTRKRTEQYWYNKDGSAFVFPRQGIPRILESNSSLVVRETDAKKRFESIMNLYYLGNDHDRFSINPASASNNNDYSIAKRIRGIFSINQ